MDIMSIHPYQWYGDPLTYSVRQGLINVYEVS